MTDFTMPETRGHLLSATLDGNDILYLSELADFTPGGSIRGGVPIIAPWFGGLIRDDPTHGWARRVEWETQKVPGGIDARTNHDEWDVRFGVQQTRDGFAMILKARNASDERRPLQLAFHPYFLVDDAASVTVSAPGTEIRFDGSVFDEALPVTDPVSIIDARRTITVIGHGGDHTVVWNPGTAADQMSDVAEGDWRRFVCVEPALLGSDKKGVSVAPWDWVSLGMTVKVTPTSAS